MDNYHFSIITSSKKECELLFGELKKYGNVSLLSKDDFFGNRLLGLLFRLSFSQRVNSVFICFWKSLFYGSILRKVFHNSYKKNIIVFDPGWYDTELVNWLRKHTNNTTFAMFFYDTVGTAKLSIKKFNPFDVKRFYDVVLTYNPDDARNYGFIQCNSFLSKIDIGEVLCSSDISFIGRAKDRLSLLKQISKKLSNNCKCDFFVSEFKKSDKTTDGIHYLKKEFSYNEYLKRELSSNCLLEILKGDTAGATLRCWEAVYYNRKLLTNWKGIFSFPYYNPKYMRYFETVDDIRIEFIKERIPVDYHYQYDNSPSVLLRLLTELV